MPNFRLRRPHFPAYRQLPFWERREVTSGVSSEMVNGRLKHIVALCQVGVRRLVYLWSKAEPSPTTRELVRSKEQYWRDVDKWPGLTLRYYLASKFGNRLSHGWFLREKISIAWIPSINPRNCKEHFNSWSCRLALYICLPPMAEYLSRIPCRQGASRWVAPRLQRLLWALCKELQ